MEKIIKISQPTETGLLAMQETLRINLITPNKNDPTLNDLQKDPEWVELFNQGYIFVGNMSSDTYEYKTSKDPKGKEPLVYSAYWDFQDGFDYKTATAYEYGNPARKKIEEHVALFTKKVSSSQLAPDIRDASKEKAMGLIDNLPEIYTILPSTSS